MNEENTPQKNSTKLSFIDGGIDTIEPLKPYLVSHKYKYDCTFLDHPLLHKKTAEDIAFAIALRLGKLKKLKQKKNHQHLEIEKFMRWLFEYLDCTDKPFTKSVKQSLAAGEKPDREDWQRVVDKFRSVAVRSNNPFRRGNKHSKDSYINTIRSFLDICVSRRVFPPFVLNGIKQARLDRGKHKILGDLPNRKLHKKNVERLIGEFLQERLDNNDIIEEERVACIKALTMSGIDITGLSDGQIMEEIKTLNTERLVELRRCAEIEFIKGWQVYQEGQRLLTVCDLSYEEDMLGTLAGWFAIACKPGSKDNQYTSHPFKVIFQGPLVKEKKTGKAPSRWVRQPLPEEVAKSRLLTLLDGRYGHGPHFVTHGKGKGVVEGPIELILRSTFRLYGESDYRSWAKQRLGASNYTLLMAQIILLIDTGFNTEVVDNLTVDCVRNTEIPTIKEIWGIKPRAGNKPVVGRVRLDEEGHQINSIEVIQRVREMTKRMRYLAKSVHPLFEVRLEEARSEDKLFIRQKIIDVPKDGNMDLAIGLRLIRHISLRNFMKEHPSVGTYKLMLVSIRPTVRLLSYMNGEDIETSSSQMCHTKIGSTTGYVMRTMSRIEMEVRIREFMKDYESIIIKDIPAAAERLGYTKEEYEERLIVAQRTGLGTICDHIRKDEEGNEFSLKQKDCDPVEECLNCPLAKVFPALKENLVDAFMMRNWIRTNEVELRTNEERWLEVWLRWLAIVEGVIDKAKTAHNVSRKMLREAEEMAEKLGVASFLSLI